jgi:hypothetical protein
MPEQNEYFNKFLEARFTHIDASIQHIDNSVKELRKEVKEEIAEVKADNKSTRYWVLGTGITVLLGLAAILLTFVQIQNSWMQQVLSFVGKTIVK